MSEFTNPDNVLNYPVKNIWCFTMPDGYTLEATPTQLCKRVTMKVKIKCSHGWFLQGVPGKIPKSIYEVNTSLVVFFDRLADLVGKNKLL